MRKFLSSTSHDGNFGFTSITGTLLAVVEDDFGKISIFATLVSRAF